MKAKQHANPNSQPQGKLQVIQSQLSYFSHSMWWAAGRTFFPEAQFSDRWENILVHHSIFASFLLRGMGKWDQIAKPDYTQNLDLYKCVGPFVVLSVGYIIENTHPENSLV